MVSRPERHGRTGKAARRLHYSSSGAVSGGAGRGRGRRPRRTERVLVGGARQVVVVALLPLWPFVAYPLSLAAGGGSRRRWTTRSRTPYAPAPSVPFRMLRSVVRHPLVNALAAPMRFLADHSPFPGRAARGRWDGGRGDGPPSAGDREPRRPRPGPPTDAIALAEPHG